MSREETLPPNYARLDKALRSIGYSFEAAVADIIDNSIDAGARKILVRFVLQRDKPLDLVIWDDGSGMSEGTLKEAMRFGADVNEELHRLGKFGLGLKLASLSQAKELRVFTSASDGVAGRGWLETGIAAGFVSTVLSPDECRAVLNRLVPDKSWRSSGTLVLWSQLYRVGQNHENPEEHVQKLLRRLKDYLSLAFHRFLQRKSQPVSIALDIFDGDRSLEGLPLFIEPLNPFGYTASGAKDFPMKFVPSDGYEKHFEMTAHIWPPNSTSPEYALPGGANSRQGFYFYRNNRLIQGGGWNGMRETEPHSSLARIAIDVDPKFDVDLSLDVKKVQIQLPPAVLKAIQQAKSSSGLEFKKYLSIAQDTYRTKPVLPGDLPLIPTHGLPAEVRALLLDELRIAGTKRHRELSLVWTNLDDNEFFRLDRDNDTLYLNRSFRTALLHGLAGSSADIPVVKCLLFFALEDALASERMSSNIRKRTDRINRILAKAVRYERT